MPKEDTDPVLYIDGEALKFAELELGEIEELEAATDMSWPTILANVDSVTVMRRLVWFVRRKKNPGLKLSDISNLTELTDAFDWKAEEDPPPPAAKPKRAKRAKAAG